MDGELLNTGVLREMMNGGDYKGKCPFMHPHKMRVNLALRNKNYDSAESAALPYRMEVDYIRYYKKK